MSLKIAFGGDHAGFEYKQILMAELQEQGIEVKDFGPYSDASCDYPDYVHPLAKAVENGEFTFGVIICGSANGVNMVANKYAGIRSAITWKKELAELTRQHNNANVLALPARFISIDEARACLKAFIETPFEGGRHENRVNKINACI